MRNILLLLRYLGLTIIALPILGFCALVAYLTFGKPFPSTLTINNLSAESVSNLTVKCASKTYAFGTLATGQSCNLTIAHFGEADWGVSGRWPDGTVFHRNFGYLDDEIEAEDTLAIHGHRNFFYTYTDTSFYNTIFDLIRP